MVKAAKRALLENTDSEASLNMDCMVRALLVICNTPSMEYKRSPAEIMFNRKFSGLLPVSPFQKASYFNYDQGRSDVERLMGAKGRGTEG